MEMRSDGFSELPDSLLIHILSFLDVKSAGITSVFLGNEVTRSLIHESCKKTRAKFCAQWRRMDGVQLPQFRLRHLTINSCSGYELLCISGIIYLLNSSPNIETLILDGSKTKGEMFFLDPAETDDLDSDLLHLKKIRVNNSADPYGEPLLTLARILLRRAPALEEMAIEMDVQDTSNFINISQTLLTYPKSSPKVEIHISHN